LHNVLDGTSNFEGNVMSMHGDKYYQQYIISCDEDERLKVWVLILNTFTNYKIYISVLTGHELEQIP
jgi:hypothetical protein